MSRIPLVLIALATAGPPGALDAQDLPREGDSVILLHSIASRGLECGLLAPWEAATIRAQTPDIIARWSGAEREVVSARLATRRAEMACDAETLAGWIDATRGGMEAEGLAHFIVIYRALATMDTPPPILDAITGRVDYTAPVAAIDAKLAELERSGAVPEGGASWPEFIARTGEAVTSFAEAIASGTPASGNMPLDRAAAIMAQSAHVTELWLEKTTGGG